MPLPIWRKVVNELTVPEPTKQWRMALEVLTATKVMMIEVVLDPSRKPPEEGTWTPSGFAAACSADGDFSGVALGAQPAMGTLLVPSAPLGALIGRIGGSTTDQTVDSSATPSRVLFSVGRKCVFVVPSSPTGSLFLGVNDAPSRMAAVTGRLLVNIFEAV
jgi:hypothetical protein